MLLTAVLVAALVGAPAVDESEPGSAKVGKPAWLPSDDEPAEEEVEPRSKVLPGVVLGVSVAAGIASAVFLGRTMDSIDRADALLNASTLGPKESEEVPMTVPSLNV